MKKTKKRFLRVIALLVLSVIFTYTSEVVTWAAPQAGNIRVYLDGEPVSLNQEPVIVNGQPMLPVKEIAEAVGWAYTARSEFVSALTKSIRYTDGQYDWLFSSHSNTIDIRHERMDRSIMVGVGNFYDTPADHNISFTVAPFVANGSMYVCADDIALCLYASCIWDEASQSVFITSGEIPFLDGQGLENRQEIFTRWAKYNEINGTLTRTDQQEPAIAVSEAIIIQPTATPSPVINFEPTGVLTSAPEVGIALAKVMIPGKTDVTTADSFYEPYKKDVGHGCNWYALGRFYETYGYQVPIQYTGGDTYLDVIDDADSTVIKAERDARNIVSGCIAVYCKEPDLGHVVFVEYVERDKNGTPEYVYYSECMNSNKSGYFKPQSDAKIKKVTFERFLKSTSNTKSLVGLVIPIK